MDQSHIDMARQLVIDALLAQPLMKWRHHGLGMLQGEINSKLRVHLWHRSLQTIPFEGYRRVHDHRFTLSSYVFHGEIIDVPCLVTPTSVRHKWGWEEETEMHSIVHAKEQDQVANVTKSLGRVYVRVTDPVSYKTGAFYKIDRGRFHMTMFKRGDDDVTITLVHRSDFALGVDARVLGSADVVGSGIVRDTSHDIMLNRERVRSMACDIARKALT